MKRSDLCKLEVVVKKGDQPRAPDEIWADVEVAAEKEDLCTLADVLVEAVERAVEDGWLAEGVYTGEVTL